jgi:hypothetical protein
VKVCTGDGLATECDASEGTPSSELCDGLDNDCDGEMDEDFTDLGTGCSVGVGECTAAGVKVCTGDGAGTECSATPGTPTAELCDGLDNDCDGSVDEDTSGGACTTGQLGACAAGTEQCQSGTLVCVRNTPPTTESCNGIDDDCDGEIDEDNPGGGGDCTTGLPGVCNEGTFQCQGGVLQCVAPTGSPEVCDDADNDCDGQVDEDTGGGSCDTGEPGECATGSEECQGGTLVCVAPSPATELCGNALDEDCDGEVDDVDVCEPAAPQTAAQQSCINELNKGLAKVAKAQGKDIVACLKNGSKGKLGTQSIEECIKADNKGKVKKAKQKTLSKAGPKCTETPGIGPNDPNTVNRVAVEKELALIHEVFGSDLDAVIADALIDQDGAKCQVGVAKAAQKCHDTKLKEFNKCKKAGLGGTLPFSRASDLEPCMGMDTNGKIKKACETKLASAISKKCPGGVALTAAFPGCATGDPGELGSCLDRLVECRVCLALNEADRLAGDCDLFDDALDNDSCP